MLNRGYYSDTCTNCNVANTTTLLLTCDCKKVGGTLHKSTVDLSKLAPSLKSLPLLAKAKLTVLDPANRKEIDEMIYNVDGAMGCCGNTGSKDWIGPPFESQP